MAPRLDLMQSAACVIRIGNDVFDSGENLQKIEHGTAVQKIQDIAN
jgi:hypothetical protein